jgi:hypothetical protein
MCVCVLVLCMIYVYNIYILHTYNIYVIIIFWLYSLFFLFAFQEDEAAWCCFLFYSVRSSKFWCHIMEEERIKNNKK